MLVLPPHCRGGRKSEAESASFESLLSPSGCHESRHYQQTIGSIRSLELAFAQLFQRNVRDCGRGHHTNEPFWLAPSYHPSGPSHLAFPSLHHEFTHSTKLCCLSVADKLRGTKDNTGMLSTPPIIMPPPPPRDNLVVP
jgi:hypothetical protein